MRDDVIDLTQYENLKLLMWDRPKKQLSPYAAFQLMDNRLAKYLSPRDLTADEKTLVKELAAAYGGGIIDGWNP